MPDIQETVKKTVKEEVERVAHLGQDAIQSYAYTYPFRGILFFLSHKSLIKPLWAKLLPSLTLGIATTAVMFLFTYIPQMAIMAFTSGPAAPLTTALLVLSESQTIFNIISKNFVISDALIDTFDGTLVAKDQTQIVRAGREVHSSRDAIGKLGKILHRPFEKFSPAAIIRYFMYLPLNFIPIVGTLTFIVLQGRRAGPAAHARYFQLKGWSASQRDKFVEQNAAAYTSFGLVATLLETVPVVNIFFTFTNQCGAALWAADLERSGGGTQPGSGSTAPKLQEQVRSVQ